MKEFKMDVKYWGTVNINTEKHGFNTIVISGPCMGGQPDCKLIGRLVQVRKQSGAFGSDTVIIRCMDGELQSFHNQAFFSVHDDYKEEIDSLFKDVKLDLPNREYSIIGKHKAKGFVVHGMDCTDGKIYTMTVTKEGDTTIIG